jgi:hypothetical protein
VKLIVKCVDVRTLGYLSAIGEDNKHSVMVAKFSQSDIFEFSLIMLFDESLQTGDTCEIEVTPCK